MSFPLTGSKKSQFAICRFWKKKKKTSSITRRMWPMLARIWVSWGIIYGDSEHRLGRNTKQGPTAQNTPLGPQLVIVGSPYDSDCRFEIYAKYGVGPGTSGGITRGCIIPRSDALSRVRQPRTAAFSVAFWVHSSLRHGWKNRLKGKRGFEPTSIHAHEHLLQHTLGTLAHFGQSFFFKVFH